LQVCHSCGFDLRLAHSPPPHWLDLEAEA
jgi:hypothetical protein